MSSKYTSIQNECLDLIEAYSEEQYHAEMAVIDSVLDMFDKISCLMEYSNPDNISIPDCSMFMESTFFQESNGGDTGTNTSGGDPSVDNKEEAQPEPQQQQQQSIQNQTNDNNKQTNTNTNREQYNKDHPFRKMNDKGKIENIFISILKFIPRLIALPIRMLISYIKKKKNNNASETMKNMTEEQRQKIAEEINNLNGESGDGYKIENGEIISTDQNTTDQNTNNMTFSINGNGEVGYNFNLNEIDESIGTRVDAIKQIFGDIDPQTMLSETILVKPIERSKTDEKRINSIKEKYEVFEERKNRVRQKLEGCLKDLDICKKRVEECIKQLESSIRGNADRGDGYRRTLIKASGARKKDLNSIKGIIQDIKLNIMEMDKLEGCESRVLMKYLNLYDQLAKDDPAGRAMRKANQNINALNQNKDPNNKAKFDVVNAVNYKGGNNNG